MSKGHLVVECIQVSIDQSLALQSSKKYYGDTHQLIQLYQSPKMTVRQSLSQSISQTDLMLCLALQSCLRVTSNQAHAGTLTSP